MLVIIYHWQVDHMQKPLPKPYIGVDLYRFSKLKDMLYNRSRFVPILKAEGYVIHLILLLRDAIQSGGRRKDAK
jgi:hypothetical protein